MRRPDWEHARIAIRPARADAYPLEKNPATAIEVGQVFRKMDALFTNWEVMSRFTDGSGVPHVRLRNLADGTAEKLIAERALRNPRFFRRVIVDAPPRDA